MKIRKDTKEQNSRLLLRFVTSYSAIIVMLLAMGLLFYFYSIHNFTKVQTDRTTVMLSDSVERTDRSLRLFSVLASQISNSSEIKRVNDINVRCPKYYLAAYDVMEYLTEIMSLKDALPIDTYYIYLNDTDYLLLSTELSDTSLYYNYSRSFVADKYEDWHSMLASTSNKGKLISLEEYSGNTNSYIYMLPLYSAATRNDQASAVCIEMKTSDIENMFSNLNIVGEDSLLITDANNQPMFQKGQNEQYDTVELIASYLEEGDFSDQRYKDYYIYENVSAYNEWHYYYIQSEDSVMNSLSTIRLVFLGTIIVTVICSFILIVILSKENVKPIDTMNTELLSSKEENLDLHSKLIKQQPYVYNSYLASILRGRFVSETMLDEMTSFLKIPTENTQYSLLYAGLTSDAASTKRNPVSEASDDNDTYVPADYTDIFVNALSDICPHTFWLHRANDNEYAILFSFPMEQNPIEFEQGMAETFKKLHKYLKETRNLNLNGGLAKRKTKINYIWEAYQQAYEVFSYLRDEQFFMTYSDMIKKSDNYYYPLDLANQLSTFIKNGSKEQVEETFRILSRENLEYRTLAPNIIHWFLSDIRNTLIKVRFLVEADSSNANTLKEVDDGFAASLSFQLLHSLALQLCSLFEIKPDENTQIVQIKSYIEKNYKDSMLSLKSISSEFHISESYFSWLFKEETGENFSEYLENIRMKEALKLTVSSAISLSEIYSEIGYNNPNSFRRAFKKVYGVSPKNVRDNGGI